MAVPDFYHFEYLMYISVLNLPTNEYRAKWAKIKEGQIHVLYTGLFLLRVIFILLRQCRLKFAKNGCTCISIQNHLKRSIYLLKNYPLMLRPKG